MNLKELKELAEKATPGPFHITHLSENEPRMDIENFEGVRIADEVLDYDAAYFTAANPQTILSLIEKLEMAEKALDFYGNESNWLECDPNDKWPECAAFEFSRVYDDDGDKAREALAKLREEV